MTELESKAAYINEMIKIAKFLPTRYLEQAHGLLPTKTRSRIKNARSGVVQDMEVLQVLKGIANLERKRRYAKAKQEVEMTRFFS